MKAEGIGITVIDAYSIKPLGRDVILAAAKKTSNVVVTVEDHYAEGGLGDAVAGELSTEGVQASTSWPSPACPAPAKPPNCSHCLASTRRAS